MALNHREIRDGHRYCPNCGGSMAFDTPLEPCECGTGGRCGECRCTTLSVLQIAEMDKKAQLFRRRGLDAHRDEE